MNVAVLNGTAEKYRSDLLMLPVIGLAKALEHMTLRPGIQYKETVGTLLGDFELRPHTGVVNKQDGLSVVKRTLEVFVGDVVTEEKVEDLRKTILGAAMVGKTKSFPQHVMALKIMAMVVKQVAKKLNSNLFTAVRDDAGTTTAKLFNGFDTITATEIAAAAISSDNGNLLDLGAITKANAVDQLMGFYREISDELQEEDGLKLFIPRSVYNAYNDDYLSTFGNVAYNKQFNKTFLEGTDNTVELVPMLGKKNSNYIHLTKKSNMLIGVDQMSDAEFVKAREVDNPFVTQFVLKMVFGLEFESIAKENMCVGLIGDDASGA